jgi:hypothetical protein
LIHYATTRLPRLASTSFKTSQLSTQIEVGHSMSIDSISAPTTFYKGLRAPCVPQCFILSQVGVRFSFVTVQAPSTAATRVQEPGASYHFTFAQHALVRYYSLAGRSGTLPVDALAVDYGEWREAIGLLSRVRRAVIGTAESLSSMPPL